MSNIFQVTSMVNGVPHFDVPLSEILLKCRYKGSLEVHTPLEHITDQQRKWWKGVLLPALSKDTGDAIPYHETRLKLKVMPDEFQPFYVSIGRQLFPIIPSITILGKKKMNTMIEGSVAQCHEDGLMWVTLPESELRK